MKKLILVTLILLITKTVVAETVTIDWTYSGTPDSFTIYERVDTGKIAKVENIEGLLRTSNFEDALVNDCKTYYIVAVNNNVEGLPSNPVGWCAETALPDMVVRPGQVLNIIIRTEETP